MRISLLIKTIKPDQSNPKQLVCTNEMVFQQKLLKKAYFIVKMTGPAIIQPTSSDFCKLLLSLTAQQHKHILTKISIVPLAIFVGIAKAWKKEVFSGPSPVLPLGTNTSIGARAPALAGAATLFARIRSRTSARSSLVNTKPTLPLMWGISLHGKSTQSKNNKIIIIYLIIGN